jgi:hypothetical protein
MTDIFSLPVQAFGWAGPWVMAAYVIVHMLRTRTRMKELQDNADGSLRKDLMKQLEDERDRCDERIDKLEKQQAEERADCHQRIAALEQMAFGRGSASSLGSRAAE